MGDSVTAIIAREGLPTSYAETVSQVWTPLAAHIATRRIAAGRPILVGINGVQGSGKSTLCLFLEMLLASNHGHSVATLSLDDLYLPKSARPIRIHPLFATRGVPGTHDVGLGQQVIDELLMRLPAAGAASSVLIPRFDKATDNPGQPQSVAAPVDVLLFEGWCVGATPQSETGLIRPINPLEASEDPGAIWRRAVNAALAGDYARLFARIDMLVALVAPDFSIVSDWRRQQEKRLRARGQGMNDAELARFIQHYERLSRHMLATLPVHADVTIAIGQNHTAGAIQLVDRPAAR